MRTPAPGMVLPVETIQSIQQLQNTTSVTLWILLVNPKNTSFHIPYAMGIPGLSYLLELLANLVSSFSKFYKLLVVSSFSACND